MARRIDPHQIIERNFTSLTRLVRNLLIDNKNFQISTDVASGSSHQAHYFKEYPQSSDFVRHVLREQAEFILERVDDLKTLAVEYSDITQFSDDELEAELARRRMAAAA